MTRHFTCVYTQMCSVCFGAGYTDIPSDGARGDVYVCPEYAGRMSSYICLHNSVCFGLHGHSTL